MKAAVLYGDYDLRYEEYLEPEIKPGCVKIKVCACGVCGSDFPRITANGAHFYPIVLGHEFSGYVSEIADDVKDIKVNDRVTCAPLIPCLECDDCNNGNYSLCKNYSFIGSRQQGAYADYIVVPARNVTKIADNVSYEQGALFEPTTISLHGYRLVDFKSGSNVAVIGCGVIGLFAIQWAKALGAKSVTAYNYSRGKEKIARDCGADNYVCTSEEDYLKRTNSLTSDKGFDYVMECSGSVETLKMTFDLVKNRGYVCMVGTPTKDLTFTQKEWEKLNRKEFVLTGSWMSGNKPWPGDEWSLTSKYYEEGKLKFFPELIYKKIKLSEPEKLIDIFKNKEKINGRIMFINY